MAEPKYVAIANKYASEIRRGVLPPNVWLPSYPEIAREHGVSEIVVRKAIEQLNRMGLAQTVIRRGTRVLGEATRTRISPERQMESPETTYENEAMDAAAVSIERDVADAVADEELAGEFGIGPGEILTHVVTRAAEGGHPISVSDTYHLPGGDDPDAAFLEEVLTEKVPPNSHAAWLQTSDGQSVMTVRQRYLDDADQVLMVSDVSYAPGRYRNYSFRMALTRE
ncbi:GntR family transcriptional regulator [Nocardia sp. NPDC057663]|uniref:GntR family transcriptional regulator n=1 Tax=Nocardia sp. NPDC057663 TaxID=3346201 RepID=UPI003670F38A